MENQKDPRLNSDDDLQAENNLLKLKLTVEHGMQMDNSGSLSPELENEWLKHVYAFEQQYKDAKPIKIYDYLGQPEFIKWDTLTQEETAKELQRIRSIMAANNVQVDCTCGCDDTVIYKFITEELFSHEIDDMRVPGMVCHFTYEEFHPNHDYDLRQQVSDFLNTIFERQWDRDYDEMALALKVTFSGRHHDRAAISAIITAFEDAHDSLEIVRLHITEVVINTHITMADVAASLSATGNRQGQRVLYEGRCSFHFVREDGYWYIDAFSVPGLSRDDIAQVKREPPR
jgi:hypothetical protein